MNVDSLLEQLKVSGNFRTLPPDTTRSELIDFSSNDYLGIAVRDDLREEFMQTLSGSDVQFTSSASRLLARSQDAYNEFEELLAEAYGRPVLTFNSGYHANSGLIQALTDSRTLILADKLVHASIIDGIMLSKCEFSRFRHNDVDHLERLIKKLRPDGENILVIVESIYSMDGDTAPLSDLLALKARYPQLRLYVDEAHTVGVSGPKGLGLVSATKTPCDVDVVVGTLGKAVGSMGAFAVMSNSLKDLVVNKARSFIFSTALPPLNMQWSTFVFKKLFNMDAERSHLAAIAARLSDGLSTITGKPQINSHIQPYIIGDARKAVELSQHLAELGLKVLPIRTPTVPPGTERLRISLSAVMSANDIDKLLSAIKSLSCN